MKDKAQNKEKKIEKNLDKLNYPADQDIYSKDKPLKKSDVEKISNSKDVKNQDLWDENSFDTNKLGGDLDVPGSELDDQQEDIGSEDEENNYYSEGDTK